jgi:hypothetical protein
MRLKVEVQNLYASIVMNLALSIKNTSDLSSLSSYIKEWRLATWETPLFKEFKSKDGIRQIKV